MSSSIHLDPTEQPKTPQLDPQPKNADSSKKGINCGRLFKVVTTTAGSILNGLGVANITGLALLLLFAPAVLTLGPLAAIPAVPILLGVAGLSIIAGTAALVGSHAIGLITKETKSA